MYREALGGSPPIPRPVRFCHPGGLRVVTADRLIDEDIQTILIEQVERVRATKHPELAESNARRWDAMHLVVVEHAELVAAETIEIVAAVVGGVQVHFFVVRNSNPG